MKRALSLSLTFALALMLAAVLAQPARAHHDEPPAAAKPASGVRAEILRQIDDAQTKLIALAEATPAEKYSWKPNDKVRSTGEVFLHVAGGNYFLPTLWGAKPPEGLDLRNIEKDAADKAKVIDALKKSFDHARKAIETAPEAELDKTIKIFGNDGTVREGFLLVATHAHEHLGQSIAYARMSGIVPPWSAGGGQ